MGHAADHAELDLQLKGYGLTTAEITYRMPDTPSLLQTYVWQAYDLAPTSRSWRSSSISGAAPWTARCTASATPTSA